MRSHAIINDKEPLSSTVARRQQTRHQIPTAAELVCRFAVGPFDLLARATQQQGGKRILRFTKCKTHPGFRQTFFFVFFEIFPFFFITRPLRPQAGCGLERSSTPHVASCCRSLRQRTIGISIGTAVLRLDRSHGPARSFNNVVGLAPLAVNVQKIFRSNAENEKKCAPPRPRRPAF
jgi:hypothetical protein